MKRMSCFCLAVELTVTAFAAQQPRLTVGRAGAAPVVWQQEDRAARTWTKGLSVLGAGNRVRVAGGELDCSFGSTNGWQTAYVGPAEDHAGQAACRGNVIEIADGATFKADRFFVHGVGNRIVVSNATLEVGSYEEGGKGGYALWLGRQVSTNNALVLRGRTPRVCARHPGFGKALMLGGSSILRYEIPPEGYPEGFVPMALNGIYPIGFRHSKDWTPAQEHMEIACAEWAARAGDEATELVLARHIAGDARRWIEAQDFGLPGNVLCFVRGGDLILRRAPQGGEQRLRTGPRRDPRRFPVGVYTFNAPFLHDETHVKELRDCDLDFVVGVPVGARKALDLLHKYGIGCVASGVVRPWHRWNRPADPVGESPVRYARALDAFNGTKGFADHPAIWAINLLDEPSEPGMTGLGEICALVKEKCPDSPAYVNLFAPSFYGRFGVTNKYLQVTNAVDYLTSYCRQVPLDYISYDYYPYMDTSVGVSTMLRCCQITADVCRETGRAFWLIAQLNSKDEDNVHCKRKLTADNLRFQLYPAMAFGVQAVSWACWGPSWWTNNVYNADGTCNADRIEVLKEVVPEFHRLGEPYMQFRNVSTAFVDYPNAEKVLRGVRSLDGYSDGFFADLKAADGSPLVVGQMVSRVGRPRRAVFVSTIGDAWGTNRVTHAVSFATTVRGKPHAYGTEGTIDLRVGADGRFAFDLKDNRAALIVTE